MITLLFGLIIGYIIHKELIFWKDKLTLNKSSSPTIPILERLLLFVLSPLMWARKETKEDNSYWFLIIFVWVIFTVIQILMITIFLITFSIPKEAINFKLILLASIILVYFMPIYIKPLGKLLSECSSKIEAFLANIESKIDNLQEKHNETIHK